MKLSRPRTLAIIFLSLLACSAPADAAPDVPTMQVPRQQHVWGRFPRGSWKRVRLVTWTLDDQGRTTGVTTSETKTSLDKIDDDGVTLRVETTVEVQGKRFQSPVQIVRQSFNGQASGQVVNVKPLQNETVTIEDQRYPCEVWQVQGGAADARRTSRVFYTSTVEPYVLRRESTWTEAAKPGVMHESVSEVIAIDMPYRVLGEVQTTAFERMTYRNAQGITTTVSVTSPDVPGGLVASTSKETDPAGQLVRRSTLEILDFDPDGDDNHPSQTRQRMHRRDKVRAKNGK